MARRVRTLTAQDRVEEALDLHGARLEVRPPVADGGHYVAPEHVELIDAPDDADQSDRASYPRLVSSVADLLSQGRLVSPSEDCLAGFIDLAYASEDAFRGRALSFARRYGLLGLCRHGEPYHHKVPPCTTLRLPGDLDLRWERLEWWRRYSRHLGAVLCVVANLQHGLPGNPEDWQAVFDVMPYPLEDGMVAWTPRYPFGQLDGERTMISNIVTRWLYFGDVRPLLQWRQVEPRPATFLWRHPSLAGLLAVQLAAAVQSEAGIYKCTECRRPFALPDGSRRRSGRRNVYCNRPGCGRQANNRRSQRRYQERARELDDGGREIKHEGRPAISVPEKAPIHSRGSDGWDATAS